MISEKLDVQEMIILKDYVGPKQNISRVKSMQMGVTKGNSGNQFKILFQILKMLKIQ